MTTSASNRGPVLVEIDPRDYQVALDQARADLANAEATAQSLNITVPITSVNTSNQLTVSAFDVENAGAGIRKSLQFERPLTDGSERPSKCQAMGSPA